MFVTIVFFFFFFLGTSKTDKVRRRSSSAPTNYNFIFTENYIPNLGCSVYNNNYSFI